MIKGTGQVNLQDTFLNYVRKENILVTVYLVNGYQLKGVIKGFDNFTVVLEHEGKQQLVYKHALSTLAPARNVSMSVLLGAEEQPEEPQA